MATTHTISENAIAVRKGRRYVVVSRSAGQWYVAAGKAGTYTTRSTKDAIAYAAAWGAPSKDRWTGRPLRLRDIKERAAAGFAV